MMLFVPASVCVCVACGHGGPGIGLVVLKGRLESMWDKHDLIEVCTSHG